MFSIDNEFTSIARTPTPIGPSSAPIDFTSTHSSHSQNVRPNSSTCSSFSKATCSYSDTSCSHYDTHCSYFSTCYSNTHTYSFPSVIESKSDMAVRQFDRESNNQLEGWREGSEQLLVAETGQLGTDRKPASHRKAGARVSTRQKVIMEPMV